MDKNDKTDLSKPTKICWCIGTLIAVLSIIPLISGNTRFVIIMLSVAVLLSYGSLIGEAIYYAIKDVKVKG